MVIGSARDMLLLAQSTSAGGSEALWGLAGVIVGGLITGVFSYLVEMHKTSKTREMAKEDREFAEGQRRLQYQRKVLSELDGLWLDWIKEVDQNLVASPRQGRVGAPDTLSYRTPLFERILMLNDQLDRDSTVSLAVSMAALEAMSYASDPPHEADDVIERIERWVEARTRAQRALSAALRDLH